MKKKSLIISSILLSVLFSALVFSTIRLFHHPASPVEPETVMKKTTAPANVAVSQTAPRAMIAHPEKAVNQPVEKALSPPKPPEVEPAPADSEENQREIARMKEHLAGNMWIPEDPRFGVDPERSEQLGKSIILADKIRKGTATPEEKIRYYDFKIKAAGDRIDIIKYIADRTAELHKNDNKPYLTEQDRVVGEKRITQLEQEINGYKEMLEKVKTETNNTDDQ